MPHYVDRSEPIDAAQGSSTESDLTRRGFFQSAGRAGLAGMAAALAAPLILPSRVVALSTRSALRPPEPGPNSKIQMGFIGIGLQNRYHLGSFLKNARTRVTAVCDVDTNRRNDSKAMADKHYALDAGAGTFACIDHRELLARPDVDAVSIASPDHWHAIQFVDACKAGKDIYIEKPLCNTLTEAKLMIDAARKYNRVTQVGSQQRSEYSGRFRRAVEIIRSGRLGKLYHVYVGIGVSSKPCDLPEETVEPGLDWDRWLGPAPMRAYNAILSPRGVHNHYPNWRLYREYAGGMVTDWGAHHFDIVQWALDMDGSGPLSVHPPADAADMYGSEVVYPSGLRVTHGGPSGITFVGEKGSLFIDRDRLETNPASIGKDPAKESEPKLPEINNHRENWVDCVLSRQRCLCDVEVGARTVAVCHLVNLAVWSRQPITWKPDAWTFANQEPKSWLDVARRDGYQLPTA